MINTRKKPNHLLHEKSPYLQQHTYNPVDWYPWGVTAFTKAKNENKPIFLSIGYATCHWCHVMAHESFEDSDVAQLLNQSFISIKVDREERPDIDNIYMTICHLLTGSGGWPLTIIMTPDKQPFFAATYLPKETTNNLKGLLTLLPEIQDLWEHKTEDLKTSAQEITNTLQKISQPSEKKQTITPTILDTAYTHLLNSFDEQYGGFGNNQKFPTPHHLLFLLRYWKRTKNAYSLKMVNITLEQMRNGGIYDHIGYGFHRYATDRKWIIPHFEKMLYDQALLIITYIEAYQATKQPLYKKTVQELIDYVLRDMIDPSHGFYSAEDADSEGQEGKFYTWHYQELKQILTLEEFKFATKIYKIEPEGNFNHNQKNKQPLNILYQTQTIPEIAKYFNKTEHEIQIIIETIRKKLFHYRKTRIPPQKDDKILTDWNALMIVALSKASQIFTTKKYLRAAEKAYQFINKNMLQKDGSLLHRYRHGETKIKGYADDYAFLTWALLELYQTTFKPLYLQQSLKLTSYLINHFWDTTHGGLYFTSDTHEQLITRTKELYDGAIPSANSITLYNLIQLARITGNPTFEKTAHQMITAFSDQIITTPQGYTHFMLGLEYMFGSAYELVIVGKHSDKHTQTILKTIQSVYLPNKVLILKEPDTKDEIENLAPFIQPFIQIDNKPTLYVCKNHHCELPTTKIHEIRHLLK